MSPSMRPPRRRYNLGRCQPNFGSKRRATHLDPGAQFRRRRAAWVQVACRFMWDDAVMGHFL